MNQLPSIKYIGFNPMGVLQSPNSDPQTQAFNSLRRRKTNIASNRFKKRM
ncbi:hypothetical protein GF326_11140 [Candidatus Bathyarchaeota archaeon]|nr:hypothetical protein [Candidatus Bathyarchaeota archaeon]